MTGLLFTVIIQKWDNVKTVNDFQKIQDLCLMTANCATSQEQPTAVFHAQFHTEKCDEEAQLNNLPTINQTEAIWADSLFLTVIEWHLHVQTFTQAQK